MKKIVLLALGINLIIALPESFAQFSIDGTIRPRAEFRNGFKKLQPETDAQAAFFIEQRSRLNFNYGSEKIKMGVKLQDVRIWGEVGQINKSDGLTSVHEAWGQILFSPKISAKIGRQELVYDDHRLLGSLGWAAQGRSHDAMRIMISDSTWDVHIGLAYNQGSDIPEPARLTTTYYLPNTNTVGFALGNPKDMEFLWFKKEASKYKLTGLVLNTGWQTGLPGLSEDVFYLTTFGLNPHIKLGKLSLFGTYYYQVGENIGAYLASFNIGYKAAEKLSFTLGGDMVSGVDSATFADGKNSPFNVLFGTHHKFYGFMDYFYVGNAHGIGGLNDFFLKTKFKASDKLALMLHAHYFMTNQPIRSNGADLDAALGTELDLVANYQYDKNINFKAGYSQMFGTSTMEHIKGGSASSLNNWAWLMVTVNPTLFTSK